MLDVDFGDMIDYLGGEAEVSSIVMYVESLTNFRKFMSAARAVSRVKPIIVLKAGRTRAGALAAASHTGAMAGEDSVYDAAFQRAGILRVKTFEELFDCAELLAKQPKPAGPGLAIITNAGGPGVMAADALADYGYEPAPLSAEVLQQLFDRHKAKALIQTGLSMDNGLLTETESKALLAAYGIPVDPIEPANSKAQAIQKATEIGYPVVMKINSRDISHKSDAGCVLLDLKNATEVADAFETIYHNAHAYNPQARIEGVTIQRMLARFTQIDYDRHIALVALPAAETVETMLGVARAIIGRNLKEAEFSVVVSDPWQGKGIGAALLQRCISIAKERGIETVMGTVLAENTQMLALGKKLGFKIKKVAGAGEYELSIDFQLN